MKKWLVLVVTLLVACASHDDTSGEVNASIQGGGVQPLSQRRLGTYVPDEVLVQWRPGARAADKARGRGLAKGAHKQTIFTTPMQRQGKGELEVMSLPPGSSVPAAIAALKADPNVEFAEPNGVITTDALPNDPYYTGGSLWNMTSSGMKADVAWNAHGWSCPGVYVGVVDTGIMTTHSDLTANIATDYAGWDFAHNDASVFDGTEDNHGTHVAGTIGAVGNNNKGVIGVCGSGVKIISAKFMIGSSGSDALAIVAMDHITNAKIAGKNVVAMNTSWGADAWSQALQDAVDRAEAQGIIVVASAGNDGTDNDAAPHYPSSFANANVISVGSNAWVGGYDRLASSNYGATSVDLGAPGQAVWSTYITTQGSKFKETYNSLTGTSMAAPHITGAIAYYKSRNPTATVAQTKAAILAAATPTTGWSGKSVTGGSFDMSGF